MKLIEKQKNHNSYKKLPGPITDNQNTKFILEYQDKNINVNRT